MFLLDFSECTQVFLYANYPFRWVTSFGVVILNVLIEVANMNLTTSGNINTGAHFPSFSAWRQAWRPPVAGNILTVTICLNMKL